MHRNVCPDEQDLAQHMFNLDACTMDHSKTLCLFLYRVVAAVKLYCISPVCSLGSAGIAFGASQCILACGLPFAFVALLCEWLYLRSAF